MFAPALGLAWYRFRATFRQRRSGYLAIIVLVGLVGGLAMGSIAAARRTASSFPVFWAHSDPSSLVGVSAILNPSIGLDSGYNAALVKAIAHLPHVTQVESQSGIYFLPLKSDGTLLNAPNFYTPAAGNGYGSVDGFYFVQDKVTVIKGHMADPKRPDALMLSPSGAAALDLHVGSVLPVGIYTNAETELPAFGTAKVKPVRIVDEHVVGIALFNTSIVEDDVFIGPGVTTTNDDTMGRHPRGSGLAGPTFRRACRVGGGAVLVPGGVIGEEAFVAAGSVVTRDVGVREVVMGVPARVVRQVSDEDLIERWR